MQLSCPALSSVPSTSLVPHCCRWISAHCSGGASPVVSIPRPSIAQAASAPATGFSEGAIAPAACPATQPTPPAARKPRSKPQLTTCRLRAGAALAAFAAAGIESCINYVSCAASEACTGLVPASSPAEGRCWPAAGRRQRQTDGTRHGRAADGPSALKSYIESLPSFACCIVVHINNLFHDLYERPRLC